MKMTHESGKVKLKCTHCDSVTEGYDLLMDEVNMYKIETYNLHPSRSELFCSKVYCGRCIQKIAKWFVRNSSVD